MELPILGQEPQVSELILGIDLGTTHSLVAVYQHGEPRVLHDSYDVNDHRFILQKVLAQ